MKPVSVCWNLTSACNLKCGYCYRLRDVRNISKANWPNVVDRLATIGIKRITVGGGEPFLIQDIHELFQNIKGRGLIASVITNGSFLETSRFRVSLPSLDEICFSIDAPNGKLHGQIRGADEGDVERMLNFLRETNGHSAFRRRVNTVVTPENIEQLEMLGERLAGIADEWKLLQVYPTSAEQVIEMKKFAIPNFNTRMEKLADHFKGRLPIHIGSNDAMQGSYFLMAPDGKLYSTTIGRTKWLGHILNDDINALRDSEFDDRRHARHYANINYVYGPQHAAIG